MWPTIILIMKNIMGSRKLSWPTIIGLFSVHIVVPWYFWQCWITLRNVGKFRIHFWKEKHKILWGVVEIINYFTIINRNCLGSMVVCLSHVKRFLVTRQNNNKGATLWHERNEYSRITWFNCILVIAPQYCKGEVFIEGGCSLIQYVSIQPVCVFQTLWLSTSSTFGSHLA